MCGCLCGTGEVHHNGKRCHQGYLDLHRLHCASVLYAVQDQQPVQKCIQCALSSENNIEIQKLLIIS